MGDLGGYGPPPGNQMGSYEQSGAPGGSDMDQNARRFYGIDSRQPSAPGNPGNFNPPPQQYEQQYAAAPPRNPHFARPEPA
jgi:hypothetical protein